MKIYGAVLERMNETRSYETRAPTSVQSLEPPQSHEQLTTIGKSLKGPLMVNMSETGLTPAMSAPEFHALGFGIVAFPTAALRVAVKSIEHLDIDKDTL